MIMEKLYYEIIKISLICKYRYSDETLLFVVFTFIIFYKPVIRESKPKRN